MWEKRVLRSVEQASQLNDALADLFAQQRVSWPALAEGEAALHANPSRVLQGGDAALTAQANARRSASTFARTDASSIAARPCFLCEVNLPSAERAIMFDDLVLMPNPFPAVTDHLTIAARDHVAQYLAPRVPSLLRLAQALGDTRFVLYNGPRCGASAPDHFHFQSGASARVPIFSHSQIDRGDGCQPLHAGARNGWHIRTRSATQAGAALAGLLDALPAANGDEAMVNVLCSYRDEHYVVLVMPRTKHRPGAFVAGGGGLAISPAALEMGGLIIVSDEAQYATVDAAFIETILQEVCFSAHDVTELTF